MKNRYYFFIAYFLILISFPFIQKKFIPIPTLKKLELISEVKDYLVKSNNLDHDVDKFFNREIPIINFLFSMSY